MTYQPTDKQMDGLARAVAAMEPDEQWADATVADDEYRASKEREADDLAKHPAFQAIVRAAQAEALRDIARHYRRSMKFANKDEIDAALMIRFLESRADETAAADV